MLKNQEKVRNYEGMILFHPKLEASKLENAISEVEKIIKECTQGSVTTENLGKKSLSFPVKKLNEAFYLLYHFSGDPRSIEKIKEEIKHNENIVRMMFIRKEN
ncbi:MAG: 30S ribosomal protein S6 [candidate division WOR-3 bacterium]